MKAFSLLTIVNLLIFLSLSSFIHLFDIGSSSELNLKVLFLISVSWGFSGAFISLIISKFVAKRAYKLDIIKNPDSEFEKEIVNLVAKISKKAGIKPPEIGIYSSPEINAFATGMSKNRGLVAISSGLINSLDREELEGVIAHEIAHIKNGDMVGMMLVQGCVNSFSFFFSRILAFLAVTSRGSSSYIMYSISQFIFNLIFLFFGSLFVLFYSRTREYAADKLAINFTNPYFLASALERIDSIEAPIESPNFSSFKIHNPFDSWLSTHPKIKNRIKRIKKEAQKRAS